MWILIITIWTYAGYNSPPSVTITSIEFSSREACISGAVELKLPKLDSYFFNNKLQCVKK